MEYPKIQSLWKREGWYFDQDKKKSPHYQKGRQSFIIGDYAEPEFGAVKRWLVQEKVDGTNIRIGYTKSLEHVYFGGRSKDAQISCHILRHVQDRFTKEKIESALGNIDSLILFGEGYGGNINKPASSYRGDSAFMLFDVWIDGWWLKQESVCDIAHKLEVPYAPIIGVMNEETILEYVKSKPLSLCSEKPQVMEGVICRSDPLMMFRDGKPIMWKLKCKEFV